MLTDNFFAGKKVLVFGLGILGGGSSITNWLLERGAQVTVTDIKNEEHLSSSLKKIKGEVLLHLGGHREEDIYSNEIIVFNPDVNLRNQYYQLALKLNKRIENEATLFYQLCGYPIVAVTGTRGKTTTTAWTRYFLSSNYIAVAAGNNPDCPLFQELEEIRGLGTKQSRTHDSKSIVVINELPSYHLELFDKILKAPDVAVITNLYPDHLNRHLTLTEYADTKAKIFLNQGSNQILILNFDNQWTPYFIAKKPKSKVWYFSKEILPSYLQGLYYSDETIFFRRDVQQPIKVLDVTGFVEEYGEHSLENLLASALSAHLFGVPWKDIQACLISLPQVPFRQETIYEDKKIKVINDTAATSPEGCVAAIKRFGNKNCILITGGTDRELDFSGWANIALNYLSPQNIVMLSGSATDKMIKALAAAGGRVKVLDTLHECINEAFTIASKHSQSVILFSPGAKSFEKFKNEWDRGEQFNQEVERRLRNERRFR